MIMSFVPAHNIRRYDSFDNRLKRKNRAVSKHDRSRNMCSFPCHEWQSRQTADHNDGIVVGEPAFKRAASEKG